MRTSDMMTTIPGDMHLREGVAFRWASHLHERMQARLKIFQLGSADSGSSCLLLKRKVEHANLSPKSLLTVPCRILTWCVGLHSTRFGNVLIPRKRFGAKDEMRSVAPWLTSPMAFDRVSIGLAPFSANKFVWRDRQRNQQLGGRNLRGKATEKQQHSWNCQTKHAYQFIFWDSKTE